MQNTTTQLNTTEQPQGTNSTEAPLNQQQTLSIDGEADFSLENLNAHLEYGRQLKDKALALGRKCLEENLFENTFSPTDSNEYRYRERTYDFWKSASLELVELPDCVENGKLEFELSQYIGCGDYETTTVWLPAKGLIGSDPSAFIEQRREHRDANLRKHQMKEAQLRQQAKVQELEKKKALLERLKKELGE